MLIGVIKYDFKGKPKIFFKRKTFSIIKNSAFLEEMLPSQTGPIKFYIASYGCVRIANIVLIYCAHEKGSYKWHFGYIQREHIN